MLDLGTVKPGTTLYIPFHTFSSDDPSASMTITGLATTDIEVYKDGGTTQRASDAGYSLLDTDGIDFDSITGIHGFSIDLADNTTAGFYASGSQYWVVVSSITLDAATVSFVAATFRIGYPDALLNTTIATLSTQTSFTLTSGPAENDALNGCVVAIHDVASAVQMGTAVISDYVGATKTVTLTAGTTFTAAATDNIAIYPPTNPQWAGAVAYSATRGLAGTALPAAAADGAGGLPVSDTGGLDLDTLLGYLTAAVATAAELAKVPKSDGTATWNATALASLQSEATDALNAYDPPTKAELDTAVGAVTLANGAHGGAAATITLSDYSDFQGAAGDPWSTALPGAYGAGTAGNIVGNNLDGTVSSRMAEASISTTGGAVDTVTTLTGHTAQTGDSYALANGANGFAAIKTDTGNLVTRITSTLFAGITSLAEWLGLLAGKQTGDATALTELRATGVGGGSYSEVTDSLEAIRGTAPLGTSMRGTDSAALASVCTEARLAELDAANLPADVDAILEDTGTTLPGEHAALPTAAEIQTQMESSNGALDHLLEALVYKLLITEASGDAELHNSAGVSQGTVAAAFTSVAGVTQRKKMVI